MSKSENETGMSTQKKWKIVLIASLALNIVLLSFGLARFGMRKYRGRDRAAYAWGKGQGRRKMGRFGLGLPGSRQALKGLKDNASFKGNFKKTKELRANLTELLKADTLDKAKIDANVAELMQLTQNAQKEFLSKYVESMMKLNKAERLQALEDGREHERGMKSEGKDKKFGRHGGAKEFGREGRGRGRKTEWRNKGGRGKDKAEWKGRKHKRWAARDLDEDEEEDDD